jgi:hypothetical protein
VVGVGQKSAACQGREVQDENFTRSDVHTIGRAAMANKGFQSPTNKAK